MIGDAASSCCVSAMQINLCREFFKFEKNFEPIFFGESMRLRRLNETNEWYPKKLERLKKEMYRLLFQQKSGGENH